VSEELWNTPPKGKGRGRGTDTCCFARCHQPGLELLLMVPADWPCCRDRVKLMFPTCLALLPSLQVSSYSSVLSLLAKGNRNRAVRHTEMNVTSSRSHAILQLVIEQWPPAAMGGKAGTVLRSKLNFVDLAGSERWNKVRGGGRGSTAPQLRLCE
jgi:hypothetical protein